MTLRLKIMLKAPEAGNSKAKILDIALLNLDNNDSNIFHGGEKVELQIFAETYTQLDDQF